MGICQADFEISFLIVVNRRDFLLGLAILLCYNMAMTPLSDTILSAKKKLLEADPKLLEAAGLTTEQRNDLLSAATNHILSSLQDNADTSTKKPFKDRAERLWWDIKQFTLDPGHLTSYSRKKQSNKDAKDRKTLITAQPT